MIRLTVTNFDAIRCMDISVQQFFSSEHFLAPLFGSSVNAVFLLLIKLCFRAGSLSNSQGLLFSTDQQAQRRNFLACLERRTVYCIVLVFPAGYGPYSYITFLSVFTRLARFWNPRHCVDSLVPRPSNTACSDVTFRGRHVRRTFDGR